ncbi:hypothetical protein CLV79_10918 [Limimaricola soesokkakensis]|uniref:Uncharacterized protein n=1 Tax=Limimaricola soesokkakensis TaxID=1343159 RepID=A0A1X6ZSL2_9RHOB|nr:hypothetical protein [Limimaricola soesokkakensis]PSK84046.1 hypothetical protein CLV79_10918 [Limimaricola soesokkakensis]SLN59855.1 hypothetical protein LOS8367_02880 [Limimaricola soesokkakensis]
MSTIITPNKIVFESQTGTGTRVLYAGFPIDGLQMDVQPDASQAEMQAAQEDAARYFEEQMVFRTFLARIRGVRQQFAKDQFPVLMPSEWDAFMPLGNSGSYEDLVELREALALQEDLIATAMPLHEAARITGLEERDLYQRLEEGKLLGIWCAGHHWRVLAFQIGSAGLLPHLESVFHWVPCDMESLRVYSFFVTPSPSLVIAGRMVSPKDWLAAGADPQPVVDLAKRL